MNTVTKTLIASISIEEYRASHCPLDSNLKKHPLSFSCHVGTHTHTQAHTLYVTYEGKFVHSLYIQQTVSGYQRATKMKG